MASATPSVPVPALCLRGVVALSARFPLLAGVDLEVAAGEAVLVEGPNGAGKTSLFRVCAGLVPVAEGSVAVLGRDPQRHRSEIRRRIGLLSHASHLYDDLTVRENVRFAVRAAGAERERIDPACERWGLTGRLLTTQASRLSAGQRRRVALAVLSARWPELWLLDEPHAGLDASARTLLDDLIAEATASGVTVLIASHEPGQVESLVHRAVTMTGGRVTAERLVGGLPGAPGGDVVATGEEPGPAPRSGDDASEPHPESVKPVEVAGTAGVAGPVEVAGTAGATDPASAPAPTAEDRVAHVA